MSVFIFHNFDAITNHVPPSDDFPECAARLDGIKSALDKTDMWTRCYERKIYTILSREEFVAAYGKKTIARWETSVAQATRLEKPIEDYDSPDIYWSAGSLCAVGIAASASVEAVKTVLASAILTHAFCIVRPPGHHCFNVPEGFCIANNVAHAAKTAIAAGKRVAILDWDYHFGNGTVDTFLHNSAVAFCSIHCARTRTGVTTYPHHKLKSGALAEKTRGRMFNVIWEHDDADDAAICYAMTSAILPAFSRFAPDIILISAGYDAIEGDTLAGMNLTPGVFAILTKAICNLGVPVVGILEGGYEPELLGAGVIATLHGMLSDPCSDIDTIAADVQWKHKKVVDAVVRVLAIPPQ
jgi:histone deacetylase 6